MITVVFCHPWHGSFNYAILKYVTSRLSAQGKDYQVIDLNQDGFNPVLTQEELRQYSRGTSPDPLVQKYQSMLQASDTAIFIFPIWWGMMPAILKGFFDKVLLKGVAYTEDSEGLKPLFRIAHTYIITTSQGETRFFRPFMVDYFIPHICQAVGMNRVKWYNCERTSSGTTEHRTYFMQEVSMQF